MIYGITILAFISIIYVTSMIWVIVGFHKIKGKQRVSISSEDPSKISVIIPFRNEEEHLLICLSSLKQQNFDTSSFEIILVNDHSTDKSVQIVKSFIKYTDISIRLTSLTNTTTKKEALKHGIALASHTVIATTDIRYRDVEFLLKGELFHLLHL